MKPTIAERLRDIADLLDATPESNEQLAKDAIEDARHTIAFGSVESIPTAIRRLKASRLTHSDQKLGRHVHEKANLDIIACLDLALEALEQ